MERPLSAVGTATATLGRGRGRYSSAATRCEIAPELGEIAPELGAALGTPLCAHQRRGRRERGRWDGRWGGRWAGDAGAARFGGAPTFDLGGEKRCRHETRDPTETPQRPHWCRAFCCCCWWWWWWCCCRVCFACGLCESGRHQAAARAGAEKVSKYVNNTRSVRRLRLNSVFNVNHEPWSRCAQGGRRNATGQATGLWRIFYKYGSRLDFSRVLRRRDQQLLRRLRRDPVVSSRSRGSRAFGANGRHREGNGPGNGAQRRRPAKPEHERAQPHRGADTGRTTRPTAIRDRLRPGLGIGTGPSAAGAGSDATEGPRAAAGAWRARWGAGLGLGARAVPRGGRVNRDRRHGVDVRYTHKTIDAQAIYPTYSVNITHHVRCSTFNASFTTCRSLRPFPESHMQ